MVNHIDVNGVALTTSPETPGTHDSEKEQGEVVSSNYSSGKGPFVGSDFPDEEFAAIRDILKERRGFDLDGYKDRCIKRRIAARIRTVGLDSALPYIELLERSEQEQEQLLAALTIHVSQFFRNPSTFALLERKILPALLERARKEGRKEVRVWSVGCAGGEEPYSIALLCQELAGDDDQVSILGTDLSPEVLKRAREACYDSHRLMEVPASVLARYFEPQGVRFRLKDQVRQQVRFFRHDILSDRPFYRADLILCRNMLIYFSRQEQERIIRTLATALPVGGYLVLGRAETLVSESRELFACVDPAERIYQRLAEPATA